MNITDKRIVITGAANGLGRALSNAYLREGATVIAVDIDAEALERVELPRGLSDDQLVRHALDITNDDAIRACVEQCATHGAIDGLINNAAVSHTGRLDESRMEDFEWVMRTNVLGTAKMTHFFLPLLQRSEAAFIANICSGIAFQGIPKFSAYASSKAAIRTFSECLRGELYGTSIHVACVFPGPINTNISQRARHVRRSDRERERRYLSEKGYDTSMLADRILRALTRRKKQIIIGREVWWAFHLKRLFPETVDRLIARFQKRLPV